MALVESFRQLVVTRPYDKIHIADIIAAADVSRSTFYEHFHNKEELLRECLEGLISPLACVGFKDEINITQVTSLMEHFRDAKEVALALLNSEVSHLVVGMLSEEIESKLARSEKVIAIPQSLVAAQIAESTLGLIRAWLNTGHAVGSEAVAQQVMSSATLLTEL